MSLIQKSFKHGGVAPGNLNKSFYHTSNHCIHKSQFSFFKSDTSKKKIGQEVKRQFDNLHKQYEPKVIAAFQRAVHEVKQSIDMRALTEACANHSVHDAQEVVDAKAQWTKHLNGQFRILIHNAYHEGALIGAKQIIRNPKKVAKAGPSLNITNQKAVDYLAESLPELIKEITEQQALAVQEILLDGINMGHSAVEMAREIRDSVGLTEAQAQYVQNFRAQLESGENLGYTPVDERRLSATDQQMATDEFNSPEVDMGTIDLLVDKYAFSLTNLRAETIAVNEIHDASIQGQEDLWKSAVDLGYLDPSLTRRNWLGTDDGREREDHIAVPEMNPDGVGIDEDFDTPVGPVHAPGQSGIPEFDIRCRCATFLTFLDNENNVDEGGTISDQEDM